MRRNTPEALSAEELKELRWLRAGLFELTERALLFALNRARARDLSVRGVARDRLLCVVEDCFLPAMRDLNSIDAEARRGRNLAKRRRAHAGRDTAGNPR